ncbi:aldose 1-epimerase [Plakobranchus ocellatus]|uniref:Galactose mutarotase n=1 Tax=Plakobranchus ocellatus TaxID=259542 RepID=A0AAV4BHM7_9GAST|nr:aldose 1-epimerase [Plakobranchus ocellatus]
MMASKVTSDEYGKTKDGQKVTRYTLSNSKGSSVQILDYGARVSSINVADKNGKFADVNLGYDNMQDWEEDKVYFGAVIGRFANRIAGGQFTLDGKTYNLHINNGPNSLHGGKIGFDKKVWKSSVQDNKLILVYVSPDGEENYPGEVTLTVTYSLDEDNALTIDYNATTTKATPINFTNHAYFNLGGHNHGPVKDHVVTFHADSFLPSDENNIPSGEIQKVEGTPMDLRKAVVIEPFTSLEKDELLYKLVNNIQGHPLRSSLF